jgi:hypothetical protein
MNTTPSIPGLSTLYARDFTIKNAINKGGFMLLAAAGFRWFAPSGTPPPGVDLSFEIAMAKWVPVGALILAAIALIVLVWRYLWIKKVLSQGDTIRGSVEDVDVYSREASHSDTTPAFQRSYIRSYYAIIRYTVQGVERKVRLKLPNSPSVYKIFKGKETELIVLDSAPGKPLIRSVYLGA